ncbi:HalOD1 output domain-containing protein [Natronorarus salvus]|uniref:HalOD1 output domain-containing protein n=1 Tax=Natronorarus salvus TaxID=3117733 RepID=UPI002F265DEC
MIAGASGCVHHAATEPNDDRELGTKIIEAIAEAKGVSPISLDISLAETIDPEALDALFPRSGDDEAFVSFHVDEFMVMVFASGDLMLYGRD